MTTLAFCSGKGSPGTTLVALNVAAALARTRETLLLDLDPSGGDVAAYLGLDPRRGLYPLLGTSSALPEPQTVLQEAEDRDGLAAMCGLPDLCSETMAWRLPDVLRAAKHTGRAVVADLGRVCDKAAMIAAEADRVLLVVRPDLVSVVGAERAIRLLEARGLSRERVSVIVSGLQRRRPADVAEVAGALRVPVVASLPFDRNAARRALVTQTPIAKGRLLRAFRELAARFADQDEAPAPAVAAGATA